jgi:hypothetical protein
MVRWGQRPYAPPNPIDGVVSVVAPIEGPLDDGAGRTSCRSRVALGSVQQVAATPCQLHHGHARASSPLMAWLLVAQ